MEGLIIFSIIFYIAIIVWMAVTMWFIFEKAGQPGWAAIIPVYNLLVFFRIIEKPWWWIFLWMIPYVQMIWIVWGYNLLAKKFGKSTGFTVGIVFLGFIFLPILAFGSAQYEGGAKKAERSDAEIDTADAVLLVVIIFMFLSAFTRFILNMAQAGGYMGFSRYFEFTIGFIWAFVPVVLGLVVKNKTLKLVCIILGGLFAIFSLIGTIGMMRYMRAY